MEKKTPENLKPCPFCGHEAVLKQTGKNELTIKCPNCVIKYVQKTINGLEWLEPKMIETWNKRVNVDDDDVYINNKMAEFFEWASAFYMEIDVDEDSERMFASHGSNEKNYTIDELVQEYIKRWPHTTLAHPEKGGKGAAVNKLLEACKEVVKGYEGDGMENMHARDEVFYRECKQAVELFAALPSSPDGEQAY